ncbi:MAG: HI0074 family nucleotidyltransferase substrate-binding subunit [Novosphingobium sp.]
MAERWQLRLDNLRSAEKLLSEGIELLRAGGLNELSQAGLIQRFEFTWELAWKTLRDFMFASGQEIDVPSPINVIRTAFTLNLISQADEWVEAMRLRNALSHEYDAARAATALGVIADKYAPLIAELVERLSNEAERGNSA